MTVEAIRKASDILGSQARLAKAVEVSPAMVNQWFHGVRQVASERCILIEKATAGAVTCEDLRPDVDWDYLRGTRREEKVGAGDTAGLVEKIKASQRNFGELPDGSPDPDKHRGDGDTPAGIEPRAG